jgi:hypothetical protein
LLQGEEIIDIVVDDDCTELDGLPAEGADRLSVENVQAFSTDGVMARAYQHRRFFFAIVDAETYFTTIDYLLKSFLDASAH